MNSKDVYNFWFNELAPEARFKKDIELDRLIKDRFLNYTIAASRNELSEWRKTPESSLAEIIVLDQFSRNIFRDTPQSFANDAQALTLAQVAIDKGFDQGMSSIEKAFCYMPFMHSESKSIHEKAIELFSQIGLEDKLKFEIAHKKIIDRFGRYPHRNKILKRESSAEELKFLDEPNSSF